MEEPPRGMKAQARECGKPGNSVKKKKRGREKKWKRRMALTGELDGLEFVMLRPS